MDSFKVNAVNNIEFVVSGLYEHSIFEQNVTLKEENVHNALVIHSKIVTYLPD
jgi:hypothetical protein